jgi:hypothetical protein
MSAFLTIVTSKIPRRLTKKWSIDEGGQAIKEGSGQLVDGNAEAVCLKNPHAMAQQLKRLESNQALIFGVPPTRFAHVVSTENLPNAAPGTIARTTDFFKWRPSAGWMMLDGDPLPEQKPLSQDEWLGILYKCAPALRDAPCLWSVSSSSMIFNRETDEQITGIRGQRLYLLVADARDIPRAGAALADRLWLAGHGLYIVSKSGQTLERCPVDTSVWQTNRFDFAAPPVCVAPLEARRPEPLVFNNDADPLVTTDAIPDLNALERQALINIKSSMRSCDDLEKKLNEARAAWVEQRLQAMPNVPEAERERVRESLRDAVTNSHLFSDFLLTHSSGAGVSVGEILDNPDKWHGERFHDPIDPEYSNSDKRIAWANLKSGGVPTIYSHAHGGTRYKLLRSVATLKVIQGELPRIICEIMHRMANEHEIYERGGRLMRLADTELVTVEKAWLQTHLERTYTITSAIGSNNVWARRDCPEKIASRIMAARGDWKVPKVAGVVSFPVMRPDGSVIQKPGFDDSTSLLYLSDNVDELIPHALDKTALVEALRRIWEPFALFPFDNDISRGVFLSALLTTVVRPTLPTAPAFLVRAFTPGTGKTLLSECLMILVGAPAKAMPLPENNEEIGKRLFSLLLTGRAGAILDNLSGVIDSPDLCVFLTSEEPEGRILGQSEIRSAPNRMLWVLNGNNVTAGGDTFRRILPVTLDANCESPEARRFTFNPRDLVKGNRDRLRADLLSVLFTYQWHEAPLVGKGALGSFGEWEALIRQCVCWLIREGVTPAPMEDPIKVLELSKAEDPFHRQHAEVLEAWFRLFGDRVVQVRDIAKLVAYGFGHTPNEKAFVSVIEEIAPPRGGFNGRYFAGWLRRHKGRVIDGLRLDAGDSTKKEPGWFVSAQF